MRRINFARRKAPGGSSFIALPPRVRKARQRAYLAAYVKTRHIKRAGALAAVDHQRHYDWLSADPEYRAAFLRARLEVAARAEAEVFRRAGAPSQSDAHLMDVLKRLRRPGYGIGPRWPGKQ